MSDAITIQYEQKVSGTNETLQSFDFIAQTLDHMLLNTDCDRQILCELIVQYANAKRYELLPTLGAMPLQEGKND